MSNLAQNNFGEKPVEIAAMNENHMACIILADTSASENSLYEGVSNIERLNQGINNFIKNTCMDELARKRVDVAIIEFNDHARVVQEFTPIDKMEPVHLTAQGCTAMGEGIQLAIDKVKERVHFYSQMGTPSYRPWIFMITDGMPTDDIRAARERIKQEESKGTYGKLKFWAVGTPGYDIDTLTSLTERCIELENTDFKGIFNWLSESMVLISDSRVDENPQLPMLPENARVIPSHY